MTGLSTLLAFSFFGCSNPVGDVDATTPYRVGFNMIRTVDGTPFETPDAVIRDIAKAGGQGMRQLRSGDLGWFSTHRGGDLADPQSYD
jgi:hypothetical protein